MKGSSRITKRLSRVTRGRGGAVEDVGLCLIQLLRGQLKGPGVALGHAHTRIEPRPPVTILKTRILDLL